MTPSKVLCFVVFFIYTLFHGVRPYEVPPLISIKNQTVCETPKCLRISELVQSRMNTSIDPCTDFYMYACGRYRTPTPGAAHAIDSLNRNNFNFVKSKLSEPINTKTNYAHAVVAKTFYQSCIQEERIYDAQDYKDFVKDVTSNWPTLNAAWRPTNMNKNDVTKLYMSNEGEPFYRVAQKPRNDNSYVILIDYPNTKLMGPDAGRASQAKLYEYFARHFSSSWQTVEKAAKEDAAQHARFVARRNNLIEDSFDMEDENVVSNIGPKYSESTLGALARKYPFFNFDTVIKSAYRTAGVEVSDTQVVGVTDTGYLDRLVSKLEDTEIRTLQNAVVFHHILTNIPVLTTTIKHAVIQILSNKGVANTSRDFQCFEETVHYLSDSALKLFEFTKLNPDPRPKLKQMAKVLLDNFVTFIGEKNLHNQTKTALHRKIQAIKLVIGGDEPPMTTAAVNSLYKNVDVVPGEYLRNKRNLRQALDNRLRKRLMQKPHESPMDGKNPMKAEAVFDSKRNVIYVSPGLISTPFYEEKVPNIVNYAKIGSLIATAIVSMFDAEGRSYDSQGRAVAWVHPEDVRKFEMQKVCYSYVFTRMLSPDADWRISGSNIVEVERILHGSSSLQVTFWAYLQLLKEMDDGKIMIKNLTIEQIFYLLFAQNFCRLKVSNIDGKSYAQLRVNGILRQTSSFQNACIQL
ncbi:neprilysin-2-like [Physella acuta]|uniref:neprilysin-2-like n=1 Tax=Physella acuta TaxID=109671 RepID=UPI0027DB6CAE|nr:neprilysin-2-like [Physella acuta]